MRLLGEREVFRFFSFYLLKRRDRSAGRREEKRREERRDERREEQHLHHCHSSSSQSDQVHICSKYLQAVTCTCTSSRV